MKKKFLYPIAVLGLLLISFLTYSVNENFSKITESKIDSPNSSENTSSESDTSKENETEGYLIVKVIDGDTIELAGGQRVRYIGIDTPETVDPREEVQCFGKEAAGKNKELVEGKKIRLEKDVSETDKYGRLLRYVYVGEIFVNDYLVREGFAKASSYPPDVKFQEKFSASQTYAQENNKGLWAACGATKGVQTSENFRLAPLEGSSGCNIKGNISSNGKIYHLPGGQYYDKTVIDEAKGERWFCTEDEAITAGWRKSKV